jgi:hypothetical protein
MKIRGVAFFGTPHKGSNMASWADSMAKLLKAASFGTSTNRKLTKELKTQSVTLADISKSFVDRSKALKILSFYESDKMDKTSTRVRLYQRKFQHALYLCHLTDCHRRISCAWPSK